MSHDSPVRSAVDPDVHAVLYSSKTPVNVDGYKLGEPKGLACPHPECAGYVLLDEDPETPGWQDREFHDDECPYYGESLH